MPLPFRSLQTATRSSGGFRRCWAAPTSAVAGPRRLLSGMHQQRGLTRTRGWAIVHRTGGCLAHFRSRYLDGVGAWFYTQESSQPFKDVLITWKTLAARTLVRVQNSISPTYLVDPVMALHQGDGDIKSSLYPCRQTGGRWKKASFNAVCDTNVLLAHIHFSLLSSRDHHVIPTNSFFWSPSSRVM